jgi:hypothetical protein
MALRYFLKYFDVVDIEHRLNIYDDDFTGDSLQIDGNVILTYSETDDPLEAIRGQGLRVELEADTQLTFNDLWSEEEKTFRVEYKRDSVTLFNGWLNPEGFFESYVNTNWIVSFDCIDGLGFLKDLSFVEDGTGLPITGRKTYLELISLALLRTGLALKINTNIDIYYTGLSNSVDILTNVYANTERYVKDDGETIMSCDEVLRDILEPFGAVLTSLNGEWYIYKPNQLFLNSTATFYTYTYLGLPFMTPTIQLDLSRVIGSDWKGATLHHCNSNQTLRNVSSIGAYRINYKYGGLQKLFTNPNFVSLSDGIIDNMTIISNSHLLPITSGDRGFNITVNTFQTPQMASNPFSITQGATVDIFLQCEFNYLNDTGFFTFVPYQIVLTNTDVNNIVTVYYLDQTTLEWANEGVEDTVFIQILNGQIVDLKITTPESPVGAEGDKTIHVNFPTPFRSNPVGFIEYKKMIVTTNLSTNTDVNGEFHTVQRTEKPSSKIEDVKEVATGDSKENFYEGTLYKNNADTPTETWNRKGIAEEKPILQIMGEETLRMSQLPSRVFSGDTYGFFNYLSVIDIEGLNLQFMPIKYSYDTAKNIISADFRQILGNELNDISYVKTLDYGNTVKPTII